jgi:hypothetical protein
MALNLKGVDLLALASIAQPHTNFPTRSHCNLGRSRWWAPVGAGGV